MIYGNEQEGYTLACNYCEDEVDEVFDTFMDAVNYKKDHGWKNVKDKYDDWHELCPACSKPEIINKVKDGVVWDEPPKQSGNELARLAAIDEAEFEGF